MWRVALRARMDQLIGKRVKKETKDLRRKLADLLRFDGSGAIESGKKANGRKKTRRKATVKYPGSKGEKWSGRGMTPLWMRPLLKQGKRRRQEALTRLGPRSTLDSVAP